MIISNSRKFIFIHIPKCGGTTVTHVLEKTLLPQDVNLGVNPHQGWGPFVKMYKKKYGLDKHSTAADIRRAIGPNYFADYFAFTFTRNPFARAYSAYTFTMRADAKHRPNSERYQEIKEMTFEDFLRSSYMQEKQILPARSQSNWIKGAGPDIHLFKLENIAEDMTMLLEKFFGRVAPKANFSRRNSSSGEEDWKNMSPEAEAIIRDLYQEDFNVLSYEDKILR